jgi:hypothetical protein
MISAQSLHTATSTRLSPKEIHRYDKCHEQLVAAERELGAFMTAVRTLFGPTEASRAAEDWIELAEHTEAPSADRHTNWRRVTIAAASRLATRQVVGRDTQQG